MKKSLLICGILVLSIVSAASQERMSPEIISLYKRTALNSKASSSARLQALEELVKYEAISESIDSLRYYGNLAIELALIEKNKDMQSGGLNMLAIAFTAEDNLEKADSCLKLSANLLSSNSDPLFIAGALINRGQLLGKKGLNVQAIELYEEAIVIADRNNLMRIRLAAETNLGGLLARKGDIATAVEYFTKSLTTSERLGDSISMANSLSNIGSCNQMLGELEKSREYFLKAANIFKKINHPNLPRPLLNLGSSYIGTDQDSLNKYIDLAIQAAVEIGDYSMAAMANMVKAQDLEMSGATDEAEKHLNSAMDLASKANNPSYVAEIKIRMAHIRGERGDRKGAIKLAEEALASGEAVGDNPIQRNALSALVLQYKAIGKPEKALEYYERQIALEAQINNDENQRQLIKQEYAYDYQKQALADSLTYAAEKELQVKEIQRQKILRNGFMGGFILVGAFATVFFYQRRRISREKQRSENLLLNILPEEIAQELKIYGKAEARDFDLVSILFTDFKGFTEASAKMSAGDLVSEINHCFESFDGIMEKYGIEKIKTIGDAYMAAGGLPVPGDDSVKNTVLAGLEMQDFISKRKTEMDAAGKPAFEMRLGIHTGPVVAGIVGVKKFQYDIWGDTVNTASRLESNGEIGKVNISRATYDLIKNDPLFTFESRGKVEAKGKGEIEMWFVSKA